jgi:hypothetical protein
LLFGQPFFGISLLRALSFKIPCFIEPQTLPIAMERISATKLAKTARLVKRAGNMDIRLALDNDELVVKIPRQKQIARPFLDELKQNKDLLISYFKWQGNHVQASSARKQAVVKKIHNREVSCCDVPPLYHWYIDDTKDSSAKKEQYTLLPYKISGIVDVAALRSALAYIVERHESLRSTFHRLKREKKDRYKMKVLPADAPVFQLDYRDLSKGAVREGDEIDHLIAFKDHVEFRLDAGPLFITRLLKLQDREFILSIKIYHVIYDAWSIEVLMRDLFLAYRAFSENKAPGMAPLKFQYKDYMGFVNRQSHKYGWSDKRYWQSLYKTCPGEIVIPGQKERPFKLPVNKCRVKIIPVPQAVAEKASLLAKKYSNSLFLVLQTALKLYLCKITGEHDMVVATMIFGRDQQDGFEDQIGLYSRMNMVRTVVNGAETFEENLKRVSKSNADVQFYDSWSLLGVLQEMLALNNIREDLLWRVAIYYTELNGYISKSYLDSQVPFTDFSVTPLATNAGEEMFSNLDLHLDFLKHKDRMDLKLVYTTDLFDSEVIGNFVQGYFTFIRSINCV